MKNPGTIFQAHKALIDSVDSEQLKPVTAKQLTSDELPGDLIQLSAGKTVSRLVWHT